MRREAKYGLLVLAVALSVVVGVEFVRMLKPANQREVAAACASLRPAPQNKAFQKGFPQSAPTFAAQDMNDQMVNLDQFRGKVTLVNFWASWCKVCKTEKPSLYEMTQEFGDDVEVLAVASDKDWNQVMAAWQLTVAEASFLPRAELIWRRIVSSKPEWLPAEHIEAYEKARRTNPKEDPPPPPYLAKMWHEMRVASSSLPTIPPFRVLLDPPASEDDNLGRVARSYGITAVPESFVIDKEGIIRYYFVNKRDWNSGVAQTCIRAMVDS